MRTFPREFGNHIKTVGGKKTKTNGQVVLGFSKYGMFAVHTVENLFRWKWVWPTLIGSS